jgi:signal transduction histidine kinase
MAGKAAGARGDTDLRLKAERGKTDTELSRKTKAAHDEADAVLKTARRRAATTLRTARAREDRQARTRRTSKREQTATTKRRAVEDALLFKEYARADDRTAREREDRARLISELLGNERRATDRSLLLERSDADQAIASRDEFLGMVSHDFRNELGALDVCVRGILAVAPADKDGRKVIRFAKLLQSINLRMGRLIGDLLDVVSIEAGKLTLIPEDHDVSSTVDEIVDSFAAMAAARHIALSVRRIGVSGSARFDRQRIQQVLGNLIMNAVKHGSEGGRIVVSAGRKGGALEFAVADDGPGIAAERLETIFDRFTQGERQGRPGLGLGLFIARRIVEAHGGRIWVKSRPAHGSTFHFTLPLSLSEGAASKR